MGTATHLLGYIEEAWPGGAADGNVVRMEQLLETHRVIGRHNEEVLGSLPREDDWPPVCRPMFGWAPADSPMITYKNRLIHFAASMKDLDWAVRDWLDKFETLIPQLYWGSIYIRCDFGYLGTHEFRWRPAESWVKEFCQARPEPIREWSFESTLPISDLKKLRLYQPRTWNNS